MDTSKTICLRIFYCGEKAEPLVRHHRTMTLVLHACGWILSSDFSLSPWSKNSVITRSATWRTTTQYSDHVTDVRVVGCQLTVDNYQLGRSESPIVNWHPTPQSKDNSKTHSVDLKFLFNLNLNDWETVNSNTREIDKLAVANRNQISQYSCQFAEYL